MRSGQVFMHSRLAGILIEKDDGHYEFQYNALYLKQKDAAPISLTLPLRLEPYVSLGMFPFFDGLIPEGWLLNIALDYWKLDQRDRMGLLLEACGDCIGAVHIERGPTIEQGA